MIKDIDQLKTELVSEIKELATDLAQSSSYVGLLSNEMKFRSLHEKFINLKFLERKHIGIDIFDEPIPMIEEIEETQPDNQETEILVEQETAQEETFIQEVIKDDISEIEETQESLDEIDDYTDLLPPKNGKKIQIDFNDRIAFLNQLFNGNEQSMELSINTLNQMSSLSESKEYLHDLKAQMNWKSKEEYIERLETLIAKRFD